jgi:Methylamine utilisation protein MauE
MPVAIAIIAAELAAAVLLLWPRTARLGAVWAATLLICFAGYALYYRYGLGNSEGLECGCFGGIIGSQLGVTTAIRNLLLLIPAALVAFVK